MNKRRFKFLYDRDGKIVSHHGKDEWKIGQWLHVDGKVKLCSNGFHCSKTAAEALSYIQGQVLAVVEVKGASDISDDKECYQSMKIVKAYKWTALDSVKLAVFAAEQVVDIYEKDAPTDDRPRKAIEAAKKYIEDPTSDAAAYAAADAAYAARAAADAAYAAYAAADAADAARAAAYAAADAAYAAYAAARAAADAADAARAAAYAAADAARAAARAAAYAAYAKIVKAVSRWIDEHISELEEYEK